MSPRSQIRDALSSQGERAAWKTGRELGIKDATIKAYISHFQKNGTGSRKPRSEPSAPRTKTKPRPSSGELGDGSRVYDIGLPREYLTIKKYGPQVSEVDGGRFISNDHLRPVLENEKERKQDLARALKVLLDMRIETVRGWMKSQTKKPDDQMLWEFIKQKWPKLSREDREIIFQES